MHLLNCLQLLLSALKKTVIDIVFLPREAMLSAVFAVVVCLCVCLCVCVSVTCLLYTSPSPRDRQKSRMPSSA